MKAYVFLAVGHAYKDVLPESKCRSAVIRLFCGGISGGAVSYRGIARGATFSVVEMEVDFPDSKKVPTARRIQRGMTRAFKDARHCYGDAPWTFLDKPCWVHKVIRPAGGG